MVYMYVVSWMRYIVVMKQGLGDFRERVSSASSAACQKIDVSLITRRERPFDRLSGQSGHC